MEEFSPMKPEAGLNSLALCTSPVLYIGRDPVSGSSHSTKGLGHVYVHMIKIKVGIIFTRAIAMGSLSPSRTRVMPHAIQGPLQWAP